MWFKVRASLRFWLFFAEKSGLSKKPLGVLLWGRVIVDSSLFHFSKSSVHNPGKHSHCSTGAPCSQESPHNGTGNPVNNLPRP